jgi:hypothetical protein
MEGDIRGAGRRQGGKGGEQGREKPKLPKPVFYCQGFLCRAEVRFHASKVAFGREKSIQIFDANPCAENGKGGLAAGAPLIARGLAPGVAYLSPHYLDGQGRARERHRAL